MGRMRVGIVGGNKKTYQFQRGALRLVGLGVDDYEGKEQPSARWPSGSVTHHCRSLPLSWLPLSPPQLLLLEVPWRRKWWQQQGLLRGSWLLSSTQ